MLASIRTCVNGTACRTAGSVSHGVRWLRRATVVLLWCSVAVLVPSAASWAASPAPAPTSGSFVPGGWDCADRTADPAAVPPVSAGSSCAVSVWVSLPAPPAVVMPAAASALTDAQDSYLAFALGLLVLLSSAHVVGSWRK